MKKKHLFIILGLAFALFVSLLPLQAQQPYALGQRTITHNDSLTIGGVNYPYSVQMRINSNTSGYYTSHSVIYFTSSKPTNGTITFNSVSVNKKINNGAAVEFKLSVTYKTNAGSTQTLYDYFTYSTYGPYHLP